MSRLVEDGNLTQPDVETEYIDVDVLEIEAI